MLPLECVQTFTRSRTVDAERYTNKAERFCCSQSNLQVANESLIIA
jgi:hypothetical protein